MSKILDPAPATEVDGEAVLAALSPSRAGDFVSCPLKYRFRTIDRLPDPPTKDALRGTLVHLVLDRLFDHDPAARTRARAQALLSPAWAELLAAEPELADLFVDEGDQQHWMASAEKVLSRYFSLEDPTRLQPAARELYVEHLLGSRLLLRGIVDRVDSTTDGELRIVDYKTGRAPGEGWEQAAFFQLRFYALVLWREQGTLPRMLQLLYLGSGEVLRYEPDEQDLLATERRVEAIWTAIREAETSADFQPKASAACSWCPYQQLCPVYGGTPPPMPEVPDPRAARRAGDAPVESVPADRAGSGNP